MSEEKKGLWGRIRGRLSGAKSPLDKESKFGDTVITRGLQAERMMMMTEETKNPDEKKRKIDTAGLPWGGSGDGCIGEPYKRQYGSALIAVNEIKRIQSLIKERVKENGGNPDKDPRVEYLDNWLGSILDMNLSNTIAKDFMRNPTPIVEKYVEQKFSKGIYTMADEMGRRVGENVS